MDYWDEVFEEQLDDDLKKLNNFSYVDGFDFNKEGSKWKFEEDKIPFIKAAKDGMSNFPLLYLPPLTKVVKYNFFIGLYSIIQVNYIYCANEKLDDEDYRSIILGDIGAYFTYFVEDFENPGEIPEPSEEFFKRLTDIKYESKEVRKFFIVVFGIQFQHLQFIMRLILIIVELQDFQPFIYVLVRL